MATPKQEAARAAAGRKLAIALEKATKATREYVRTCKECNDASAPTRGDDGRLLLIERMSEYAGYLDTIYGDKA